MHRKLLVVLCFLVLAVNTAHGFEMGFVPAITRLDMSFQTVPEKEFSDIEGTYKIRSVDVKAAIPLLRKFSIGKEKVSNMRFSAQVRFQRSIADISFLPRSHLLYNGTGGVSCRISKNRKHSFVISGNAGFAEDDKSIDDVRLRYTGFVLGNYRKSRTFSFIYGAGYAYVFGKGYPFPVFGLNWKPAPKWNVSAILPVLTHVAYTVNKRTSIHATLGAAGNRSRFSNENVYSQKPEVINLKVVQAMLSFGINHKATDMIALYGSLGVYFARNFALVDDDEDVIVKTKMSPTFFLKTGIKFSFHERK